MLPTLILLLGLPLALAAETPTCAPLVSITFDNATIPELLGQWVYIASASKYLPHLEEIKAVKYEVFSFSPGSHEDELNVSETIRLNETCVVKNTSKIQIFWHNSTLMHVNGPMTSKAKLIQSDKDLLILKHVDPDVPGLSLSARTHNVSKEHMEWFKAHLRCLGFTAEEMYFTSEKDACPLPGEKTGEGDAEP